MSETEWSMVERVADAIGCVNYGNCFQDVPPAKCESCKTSARRAIETMREPTAEMKNCSEEIHWGYSCNVCGGLQEGWHQMIDAALKDHSVSEPAS